MDFISISISVNVKGITVQNLLIVFWNLDNFKVNCSTAFCLLLSIPNRGFLHSRKSRKTFRKYIHFSFDVEEGAIKLIKIKSPSENSLDAEFFESRVIMIGVYKSYGARDHF